jgi:hypothetical protein
MLYEQASVLHQKFVRKPRAALRQELDALQATEIKASNGYVMGRAGSDAALKRARLDQDWKTVQA